VKMKKFGKTLSHACVGTPVSRARAGMVCGCQTEMMMCSQKVRPLYEQE